MAVATPETETLRLDVEGMTCASCAARIERKLNELDGVEATVNYATEAGVGVVRSGVGVGRRPDRGRRGGRLPRRAAA